MEQLNSPDILIHLIDKYRELPCLWDVRNPAYLKADLRTTVLEEVTKYMQTWVPEVTGDIIRNKINNLRNTYQKVYVKEHVPPRSGAAASARKEPTLWYYKHLSFLADQMEARDSLSTLPPALPSTLPSSIPSTDPPTPAE